MPIHTLPSAVARPASAELAPLAPLDRNSHAADGRASAAVTFAPVQATPVRLPASLARDDAGQAAADGPDLFDRIQDLDAPDAQDLRRIKADSGKKAYRALDNRLGMDLSEVHDRHAQALKAGVNVAKRSFYQRLGGAITVALAAAALIAVGVATGGTVVLAAGIVGAVTALRMGADTACARMAVVNAQEQARGEPPKYKLPMGSDSLGNLFYHLTPRKWTPEQRENQARRLVLAFDSLVIVGSCVATAGVSGLAAAVPSLMLMGIKQALEDEIRARPSLEQMLTEADDDANAPHPIADRMLDLGADIDEMRQALAQAGPDADHEQLQQTLALKEKRLDALVERVSHALEAPVVEASRSTPSRREVAKGMGAAALGLGLKEAQHQAEDALELPLIGNTLELVKVGLAAREVMRRDADMSDMTWLQGQAPDELRTLKQRMLDLAPEFEMVIEEHGLPPAFA